MHLGVPGQNIPHSKSFDNLDNLTNPRVRDLRFEAPSDRRRGSLPYIQTPGSAQPSPRSRRRRGSEDVPSDRRPPVLLQPPPSSSRHGPPFDLAVHSLQNSPRPSRSRTAGGASFDDLSPRSIQNSPRPSRSGLAGGASFDDLSPRSIQNSPRPSRSGFAGGGAPPNHSSPRSVQNDPPRSRRGSAATAGRRPSRSSSATDSSKSESPGGTKNKEKKATNAAPPGGKEKPSSPTNDAANIITIPGQADGVEKKRCTPCCFFKYLCVIIFLAVVGAIAYVIYDQIVPGNDGDESVNATTLATKESKRSIADVIMEDWTE